MAVGITKEDVAGQARVAMEAARDKKAEDVIAFDVSSYLGITDFFIVATGNNERHIAAIADSVEEALRETFHLKPLGREGRAQGAWTLLDYGDFVIHLFRPDAREEYRLDKLWNEAPRLAPIERGTRQVV